MLIVWSQPNHPGRDVLGFGLVPIALLIAAAIHSGLSRLMRRVLRMRRGALVIAALVGASSLHAQAGGVVEGTARNAEDGAAIPFALIRLVPSTELRVKIPPSVTDADGRFSFSGLPAGEYRLQLERIGFERAVSPTLQVRSGETIRHELRAASQPLPLASMTVRPGDACLTVDRIADDPGLAALWNEARKGVEIRRAFESSYRFVQRLRQDGTIQWRFRRDRPLVRDDTLRSEPDSVAVREARRQARIRKYGYAQGNLLTLPSEKELLDEAFLRDHCFTTVERTDDSFGIRFRPVAGRAKKVDIEGTIWVDATNFLARRLDVVYVDGGDPFGEGSIIYTDITVDGRPLRVPTSGIARVRMRGTDRALAQGANVDLRISYWGFEKVR